MPRTPKSIVMDQENPTTEKTIVLKETEVNALLSRIEALEKSKSKKSNISTEKKIYNGPRFYHVRLIDNKVISHFEMTRNTVKRSATGGWDERQECRLTYSDGSTEDMLFFDYTQDVVWSDGITPIDYETYVHVTFVDQDDEQRRPDGNPPTIMTEMEFNKKYKTMVEGISGLVIDHDIVYKAIYHTEYTFKEPNLNNGEEFTVDDTAIN